MSLKLLQDKVCVLTGVAQGLGQALSLRMAEEGCHVAIADMKEEQLKATAAEVAEKTETYNLAFLRASAPPRQIPMRRIGSHFPELGTALHWGNGRSR